MKIGGYLPVSLCDWPGTVAAVIFTRGCCFRCPWCHNGDLLEETECRHPVIPEEEVLDRLRARRGLLGGVVLTGGEPTLQPDLVSFAAGIRELGLRVKLDTNGAHPEVVRDLISRHLVDFVAMDIKAPWEKYPLLTGLSVAACPVERIRETRDVLIASGLPIQFRTTCVDPLLTPDDYRTISEEMAQILRSAPNISYVRQPFIAANALDPALRNDERKTSNVN